MHKKTKIYLDTSAISYLEQDDTPEKMSETREFWEDIKNDKYEVFISDVVIEELQKCYEEKRMKLYSHIADIKYKKIEITNEINDLAKNIIDEKILPEKCIDDSRHIASAIISGCAYLVSWNMKHIANVKTNSGIRIITIKSHFPDIMLVPPTMLMKGDE